jgi:hypothetical protein
MVPVCPTATYCVPDQTTPYKSSVVLDVISDQVTPSGEMTMVPPCPTTTYCASGPDHAAPYRYLFVPAVCVVHVTPSGDVLIMLK